MRLAGRSAGRRSQREGEHVDGPKTFTKAYIMTTCPFIQVWIRYMSQSKEFVLDCMARDLMMLSCPVVHLLFFFWLVAWPWPPALPETCMNISDVREPDLKRDESMTCHTSSNCTLVSSMTCCPHRVSGDNDNHAAQTCVRRPSTPAE